jgi:hypothetical protein
MVKIGILFALTVGLASASVVYDTAVGATTGSSFGNLAIDASATFTFATGTLTITLKDLESGISTVGQNVSDLQFDLSVGGTTTMVTTTSEPTITCGSGSCGAPSTETNPWGFGDNSGVVTLCIICSPSVTLSQSQSGQPAGTILGPSPVSGGSLETGSHNPFINQTLTIVLDNSAFTTTTSYTTISNVMFSFGTTAGDNVGGMLSAPEPASMALAGAGLLALGLIGRRRFGKKR